MTVTFWIVLLVLAAAIAVATMRRTRPESRISEAQRLPPRDDLSGLGLSAVRPATPRETVPAEAVPEARPAVPRPPPAARPVVQATATPVARPSDWVDEMLAADARAEDAPLDARHLDPGELDAPAGGTLDLADLLDVPDPDRPTPAAEPSGTARDADDAAVWTFDRDAAEDVPATAAEEVAELAAAESATAESTYVRDGQTLWPTDAAAASLLAASLAARLGGSVAVVRHDAAGTPETYLVELLAGPAAAADPAPIPAGGHPFHRVPQDGVLSLLAPGADLPYLGGAPAGQVLVRSLAPPPAARVLLVADVPPDAPDVDGPTATLVDGYAALFASLSHLLPSADATDTPDDVQPDALSPDETDLARDDPRDPDAPAEAEQDAEAEEVDADEPEVLAEADAPAEPAPPAGLTHARDTTVASPNARRGAVPPPPRGVILAGEIAAARRDRRLLVFALATVADAETVLRGGADGVVRAEAALRQRLTAGPGVRRVEPFGDLLFGVFLDAEGPEVVAWAERLSGQGRPLLVGAVPATGAPDLVRATATAALQSAYEREVVCVVAS